MKKIIKTSLIMVAALSATSVFADAKNSTANASYIIGYSIAQNMTKQLAKRQVKLNQNELNAGFLAGIKVEKPKLSKKQMEAAMQALQKELERKQKAQH